MAIEGSVEEAKALYKPPEDSQGELRRCLGSCGLGGRAGGPAGFGKPPSPRWSCLTPLSCADDESDSDAEEEQTTVRDSAVPSRILSQCHIAGKQISVPVSWEVLGELGLSGAEYKSTSHPTHQWRLPRSSGWSSSALYK